MPIGERLPEDILELPRLVAPERKTGGVVTFDEEFDAELSAEARTDVERGRQVGETNPGARSESNFKRCNGGGIDVQVKGLSHGSVLS
jgi:hypothetical protein